MEKILKTASESPQQGSAHDEHRLFLTDHLLFNQWIKVTATLRFYITIGAAEHCRVPSAVFLVVSNNLPEKIKTTQGNPDRWEHI